MENKKLVKASLALSSTYLYINIGIFVSIFGNIVKTYSSNGAVMTNLIYLIPNLTVIPFIFIGGKLCSWFSKKTLLVIGLSIFSLAGAGTLLFENIYYVLAMRALLGVGMGILYPLARALAVQYFDGEERASMLGIMQATACGIGVLLALASGRIAVVDYHYALFLYLIALPIALLAFLALPKDEPEKKLYQHAAKEEKMQKFSSSYYYFLAAVFFLSVILVINQLKMGVFVTTEQLGTPMQIGIGSATVFVAGFLSGMLFGKIYTKIERYTIALGCCLLGTGYVIYYFTYSITGVYLACATAGAAVGLIQPYFTARVAVLVPKERATMAITYLGVVYSLAYFLASYIIPMIESLFNVTTARGSYLLFGVIALIGFVVSIVCTLLSQSSQKKADNVA